MTRFIYDTAVFVYAFGGEHHYKAPCQRIVEMAGEGRLSGEAATYLLQEFARQRARRTGDRDNATYAARRIIRLCRFHAPEVADMELSLTLFAQHAQLDARDCVFAAVALNRGIGVIVSPDRAFDFVQGLQRIDPADSVEIEALATPKTAGNQ